MSSTAASSAPGTPLRSVGEPVRVALMGSALWLDGCFPTAPTHGLQAARFEVASAAGEDEAEPVLARVRAFRPHVSVVLDPPSLPIQTLRALPGVTLGVLVGAAGSAQLEPAVNALDRVVSFQPALTGEQIGAAKIWRAIPPPISDALYGEVRPLHRAPRTMALGRSTEHRELMLMPAKHHHDLLQVIHGVSGEALVEILREYDVGVYVARESGGGFGHQVGVHLAAGHLLLSEQLSPAHGLERSIDYLQVESADGLVGMLDRLGRFPEMYERVRVRGRLKAEQYRASRLFARLTHDLLADVAAFGTQTSEA